MPLNIWIFCEFYGTSMFIITYILFGLSSLTSFEIINLVITLENTIKTHFFEFKLMLYSLHFWNHNMNFYKWVSMSL
jgi:hypothetical protein